MVSDTWWHQSGVHCILAMLHTPRWVQYEQRRLSSRTTRVSVAHLCTACQVPRTVLRMQLDQEVAKGPVCDALNIRFPVCRSAGERRSRKLGQRMEVDVVGHCVQHVGQQGCQSRGQQYRCAG